MTKLFTSLLEAKNGKLTKKEEKPEGESPFSDAIQDTKEEEPNQEETEKESEDGGDEDVQEVGPEKNTEYEEETEKVNPDDTFTGQVEDEGGEETPEEDNGEAEESKEDGGNEENNEGGNEDGTETEDTGEGNEEEGTFSDAVDGNEEGDEENPDDVEGEEGAEDGTGEETTEEEEKVDHRNYTLLEDFKNLYERLDSLYKFILKKVKKTYRTNQIYNMVSNNLVAISDDVFIYMTNTFHSKKYPENLLQYNKYIEALKLNLEILKKIGTYEKHE